MPTKPRHPSSTTIDPEGTHVCACCGIRYNWTPPHAMANRRPIYCGDECAGRVLAECWQCGQVCKVLRQNMDTRPPACSFECGMVMRNGTPLPDDHWARWYGKSSQWHPPRTQTDRSAFVMGYCADCGQSFVRPRAKGGLAGGEHCSKACARRTHRRARRAREYAAPGTFRWVDVMRIFIGLGGRCAYCGCVVDGSPDPDHVIPLSRGGDNTITNILPACQRCNGEKCDRTPREWMDYRRLRGRPKLHFDASAFPHLQMRPARGRPMGKGEGTPG